MKLVGMFSIRSLFTGIVFYAVIVAAQAGPPDKYPFLSYDKGMRLARQESKKIFLYFGREGCGWCEKTNKEAFSDPQLRQTYISHYVLVYVDTESGRRLTLPNGERITEPGRNAKDALPISASRN